MITRAPLAGIAHWGSPAPVFEASFDLDGLRGITDTPDEIPLWDAWIAVASQREAANRSAGPSSLCLSTQSL